MDGVGFGILGDLEVWRGSERLAVGGHRQRAVLALLVVEANRVVSADRLIDELWGEEAPAGARTTLQAYVCRLRRGLETGPGEARMLGTQGRGYVLRVADDAIDARRFERLAARGQAALAGGHLEFAAAALGDGLALWRGPALAEFTGEPFAAAETARLSELRLAALEDRAEADLALGRHRTVVTDLEPEVATHPFREPLRAQLMVALYRSGRHIDALRAYHTYRNTLHDELGVEPGPALKTLERAILAHHPTLDRAPPRVAGPPDAKDGSHRPSLCRTHNCHGPGPRPAIPLHLTARPGRGGGRP